MGEARRRARLRAEAGKFSKPISRARFNILAIGARSSRVYYLAEERSWWSSLDERLLALVARDKVDGDFSWVILARDELGRFRAADLKTDYPTEWHAEDALKFAIADIVQYKDIAESGKQLEKTNSPVDLLKLPLDCDPKTLHPYFRELLESPSREPGRAVIREIGPWLTPADPHLAREFQNKGFDQRLWEIYLWAVFKEFGLDVEQLEAPDFRCTSPIADFTVEATTAAPSTMGPLAEHPQPKTVAETTAFLDDYMPLKYGSALMSKLKKTNKEGQHYWERSESKDKPFLLAIADFHKPVENGEIGSMTYTQSALWQYLYGQRVFWEYEGERLVVKPQKIDEHKYREKVVRSGFFDESLAENISAVIFSNAGTIAKFDRMGTVAGFGAMGFRYMRIGLRVNPDPNAIVGDAFSVDVASPDYQEYWTDEIQVFHNPKAKYPLPFNNMLGATHHYFEGGMLRSLTPKDAVLSSYTLIIGP